jgi:hypothetical protein
MTGIENTKSTNKVSPVVKEESYFASNAKQVGVPAEV